MTDDIGTNGMGHRPPVNLAVVAAVALALLAIWVVWQFGGFDLMATISVDGRTSEVANTFATVDHPFHATRAHALLESLKSGDFLRWIGNHQGGYPVEFYPLGVPGLEVALWAALLGSFPIIAVHKLTVLVLFVLPAIGFWYLARGDRLNPFVPVLALAIHVATPGIWTSGGMVELIEWGLVANVGGASLAFVAFAALVRYVREGTRLHGVVAALAAAAALYANTRSGIAMGVAAVGILVAATVGAVGVGTEARPVAIVVAIRRVALVGLLGALLTAPLLLAMAQYGDSYFFVNYNEYQNARAYWQATVAAVSRPMFWIACAGLGMALVLRTIPVQRTVAVTGVLYAGLTLLLSQGKASSSFIQQLETPRLMPFQRLLLIYLAAATIGYAADLAMRFIVPRLREPVVASGLLVGAVLAIVSFPGDYGTIPPDQLQAPATSQLTGQPEFQDYSAVVAEANEIRPEGTAIYVVGDQRGWWHEQLWGPTQSGAPFYYDDWMWYWREETSELCNTLGGHWTPDPARTFTPEWFQERGIGVLVVTTMQDTCGGPDPRLAAESVGFLEPAGTVGNWDLYVVREPGSIVTSGSALPESITVEDGAITATFEAASGEVQVRQNWYPRWQAWADGERVDVRRGNDGFMVIDVPDGTEMVELRYAVTAIDWLGRLSVLAGLVLVVALGTGALGKVAARISLPAGRIG